jgi:hypothetical protein
MGSAWIAVIVTQWIVIAILCLVCIGILRYLAVFRERMELAAPSTTALSIGERIPELEFQRVDTDSTFQVPRGRACMLAFVSTTCGGCTAFLTQVDEILIRGRRDNRIDVAIAVMDADPTNFVATWKRIATSTSASVYAVRDTRNSARGMLGVWTLPTVVIIDERGRISDQTTNPHITGWLYKALKEERPVETTKPVAASVNVPAWMDVNPNL